MIKPTVGRAILYWPPILNTQNPDAQPYAATIAYVHGDRLINIAYIDHNSVHHRATSVMLVQPDDETRPYSGYCEWMPYQKAVAAGEVQPTKHA